MYAHLCPVNHLAFASNDVLRDMIRIVRARICLLSVSVSVSASIELLDRTRKRHNASVSVSVHYRRTVQPLSRTYKHRNNCVCLPFLCPPLQAYTAALESDASYAATLSRSLSLVLDEFYKNLRTVGVSALTGEGMDAFFEVRAGGVVCFVLHNRRTTGQYVHSSQGRAWMHSSRYVHGLHGTSHMARSPLA